MAGIPAQLHPTILPSRFLSGILRFRQFYGYWGSLEFSSNSLLSLVNTITLYLLD